jgi:hypothetical protein
MLYSQSNYIIVCTLSMDPILLYTLFVTLPPPDKEEDVFFLIVATRHPKTRTVSMFVGLGYLGLRI